MQRSYPSDLHGLRRDRVDAGSGYKGRRPWVGAVGGVVVVGLVGNELGSGRGNAGVTAIGTVCGATAGNEIQKRMKTSKTYDVTVRLDDGTSRVITDATSAAWRAGNHVKLVSGAMQANS
jgi:outer membrane lipoprotein SlyB